MALGGGASCPCESALGCLWSTHGRAAVLIRPARPSTEGTQETERRLAEAQSMIARFARENERLAALNETLASRRAFVDSDYKSAGPCWPLPCALTLISETTLFPGAFCLQIICGCIDQASKVSTQLFSSLSPQAMGWQRRHI